MVWIVLIGLLALAGGLTGGYYLARFRLDRREEYVLEKEHELKQLRIEMQRNSFQESVNRINNQSNRDNDDAASLQDVIEEREREFSILEKEAELEQRMLREENEALKEELNSLKHAMADFPAVIQPEYIDDVDADVLMPDSEVASPDIEPVLEDEPALEASKEDSADAEPVVEEVQMSVSPEEASEAAKAEEHVETEDVKEAFEAPEMEDVEKAFEAAEMEDVEEAFEAPEMEDVAEPVDSVTVDEHHEDSRTDEEVLASPEMESPSEPSDEEPSETPEPAKKKDLFGDFEFHWTPTPEPQPITKAEPAPETPPASKPELDSQPDLDNPFSSEGPYTEADLDYIHDALKNLDHKEAAPSDAPVLPAFQSVAAFVPTGPSIRDFTTLKDAVGLSADQFELLSDLGYGSPSKIAGMSRPEIARLSEIFHVPVSEIESRWMPAAERLSRQN